MRLLTSYSKQHGSWGGDGYGGTWRTASITPLEWEPRRNPTINNLETQALSGTLRQLQALIISPSGQNQVKGVLLEKGAAEFMPFWGKRRAGKASRGQSLTVTIYATVGIRSPSCSCAISEHQYDKDQHHFPSIYTSKISRLD